MRVIAPRVLAHVAFNLQPPPRLLPAELKLRADAAPNRVGLEDDEGRLDGAVDCKGARAHARDLNRVPDVRVVHVRLELERRRRVLGQLQLERQHNRPPVRRREAAVSPPEREALPQKVARFDLELFRLRTHPVLAAK